MQRALVMNDFEKILGTSKSLATGHGLPTTTPDLTQEFQVDDVHTLVLDSLIGQIAVLPQQTNKVTLTGYGDGDTLAHIQASVRNGALTIHGQLPYKPGNRSASGIVIGGGSIILVNNHIIDSNIGRGEAVPVTNNEEIDTSRPLTLKLTVPQGTNLRIKEVIGVIGVGPELKGEIDFSTTLSTHLFAHDAIGLNGDISGDSSAEIASVTGDVDVEVSGNGSFRIGQASGKIAARINGNGSVAVEGGHSQSLRASVSGSGRIMHHGGIDGHARLRISGSGKIAIDSIKGDVDHTISGSGSITANGQSFGRWLQ